MHPLSHHEIFGLVGPFARCGRHVDLECSDRANRCLMFKSVAHPGAAPGEHDLCEVLRLENPASGRYLLTRELTAPGGLRATLRSEGADPSELLEHVQAVAPHSHFKFVAGIAVAVSYRIEVGLSAARGGVRQAQLVFTQGHAFLEGLALTLEAAAVKGNPASIVLEPHGGAVLDLPADLVAVLGWEWGLLCRRAAGWRAPLRLRRKDAGISAQIERRLENLVAHLAAVLARPPAEFHDSLLRARWGVTFRRAVPLLVFVAIGATALVSRQLTFVPETLRELVCMSLPPALLILGFGMQQRPALEIPMPPRRLAAIAWRQTASGTVAPNANFATPHSGTGRC